MYLDGYMAELVDAADLGSATERCVGSTPTMVTLKYPGGEMAATKDLKSFAREWACGFESRLGYKK